MRIGFFTDTYLPVVHGVQVSIDSFRKELEAMGHEVYIYAPESPGYKDKNPHVFRFKSQRIIKNPEMRYANDFLPVGHTLGEISRFKLDIAHAHTPFGLGFLAKFISERQLIPLIYTHHTHYPEYAKMYFKEKIFLPYLAKIYTAWFSNFSDAIIAPSPKMKKLLHSYGVRKRVPIYILPTGIDLNFFKKTLNGRTLWRRKLKIPAAAKVLITVSRIGKEKNIEFLLKAFKEMVKRDSSLLFLVVGDGPYLEALKEKAKKLGINQNIIFTGMVPRKHIQFYYQSADIFVFASLTDTQGIVILEALSCGLSVVALKDDAFALVVKDSENGFLIKDQSVKLFAGKANSLLDNPSLRRKFSAAGILAVKEFSEEKMAKKLIGIYEEQIKKSYNRHKR